MIYLRLFAFKDFSDAIDSLLYALDPAWNVHSLFLIALTPTLSSFVSPALPLNLLLVKDYSLIIIIPVSLFITDYRRRRHLLVIIISFPLIAPGTLTGTLIRALALFSFRLSRGSSLPC